MLDRRSTFRSRVYYGGSVAFNERRSKLDCTIRNYSDRGALVDLGNVDLLAGEFDLTIPHKGLAFRARLIWRRSGRAGFAFRDHRSVPTQMTLNWALRVRAMERANKALTRRVEQLSCER
ncbi:PilZ domain-containing protein [Tardiphaga sp. vice352]|uniref:PilZ domain-containing protein n=2 Tax=Tardiphaga TaxID=1395974 RepID=UPI001164DEE6|nr:MULTISPECIES: PilZ domain-containing protein [unclassified Tardiphaga]QDM17499.1 PilZ domain-containing protein [Tardiphaga sp. vice278]QDM22467.1 PilZ domain-containing protein [Tardiphaga sp. vice154]QDM27755.1 PilZ domain-containing protein [Tardiphaga sp. vice304]QDM32907.1 PilZ domain-containing protein [Tardiphaga sp. vice352]